jgi:hypothetical protein
MGILTSKPRGRNGRRPAKLTPEQWRELGRHAYLLRRGKPFPEFELRSDRSDDWDAEGDWVDVYHNSPVSLILDARDGVTRDIECPREFNEEVEAVSKVINKQLPRLRDRHLRPVRNAPRSLTDGGYTVPVPVLHHDPHWAKTCVIEAAVRYRVLISDDTVRRAEKAYRELKEDWEGYSSD